MRTTSELADQFSLELIGDAEIEISTVSINTQHLGENSLFIAVQGANSHGLDHLETAIAQGAVAVLSDRKIELAIPSLYHPNPRLIAGQLASEVCETADSNMLLYAVTGTNGKTSTVFFLRELLDAVGQSAGLISSAFSRVGQNVLPADLTTPEAPRTHQLLSQMRDSQQFSAAIEASAQGLSRHRLDGLRFRIAGFTNLSRDHLDDYPDMDSYLAAKAQLFTEDLSDRAVVFLGDDHSHSLYESISIPKVAIGKEYQFIFESGNLKISGKAELSARIDISSLMAKNLALAIVMLLEDGYAPDKLERALALIDTSVPGRLQRVSLIKPAVFVDYAHTPAAVEASAKELSKDFDELTIVLSASGNRDAGKRPEMAKAAALHANRIVVTDQHPRDEEPAQIRREVISGLEAFEDFVEVADPAEAISRAIEMTSQNGAVLWCGPGHLKYREIRGQKIAFDAIATAREALGDD